MGRAPEVGETDVAADGGPPCVVPVDMGRGGPDGGHLASVGRDSSTLRPPFPQCSIEPRLSIEPKQGPDQ